MTREGAAKRGAGSGVPAAALARQAEVLLGHVDADGAAAQLPSHEHRRPGAAERVEQHPTRRARGEDGDAAEVGRERREVRFPALRVLRHDAVSYTHLTLPT